ncbi:MAG: hypothetical protein HY072_08395, partial [Deltaproteobacteria bacterium]|nr:hypothetical protein [Deltaproteobacteria bacterium]
MGMFILNLFSLKKCKNTKFMRFLNNITISAFLGHLLVIASLMTSCEQNYTISKYTPKETNIVEPGHIGPDTSPGASPPGCPSDASKSDPNKILFYAPDVYTGLNQNGFDQNIWIKTAIDAVKKIGFQVTLDTRIDIKFDVCKLYSNYSQLWLFSPCNNLQMMTDESFNAVLKYYEYGKAVVALGDFHFFNSKTNNINDHCTALYTSNSENQLLGTDTKPNDRAKIISHVFHGKVKPLGAKINTNISKSANHILGTLWANAPIGWSMFTIDTDNRDVQSFCKTEPCLGDILLIDKKATSTEWPKRFLLAEGARYVYHGSGLISNGSTVIKGTYFDVISALVQKTALYFRDGKLPDN